MEAKADQKEQEREKEKEREKRVLALKDRAAAIVTIGELCLKRLGIELGMLAKKEGLYYQLQRDTISEFKFNVLMLPPVSFTSSKKIEIQLQFAFDYPYSKPHVFIMSHVQFEDMDPNTKEWCGFEKHWTPAITLDLFLVQVWASLFL